MSKKNQKLVTPAILRQAVIGSFTKLNPVYMMKNPVMFVVEIGFFITLVLLLALTWPPRWRLQPEVHLIPTAPWSALPWIPHQSCIHNTGMSVL